MPWELSGNAGTDPTTDFLGTTDAQPLVIKTNGNEVLRLHTTTLASFPGAIETPAVELQGANPLIDFHFGGAPDFDVRIINDAARRLRVVANALAVSGVVETPAVELQGDNPLIDFHFGGAPDFDVRIINDAARRLRVVANALAVSGVVETPAVELQGDYSLIDFHFGGAPDFDVRIINDAKGTLTFGARVASFQGRIAANALAVTSVVETPAIELQGDYSLIDFHFGGAPDFDVRIINDAKGTLTFGSQVASFQGRIDTRGGIRFGDGSHQTTATLRGPQGIPGPQGPQGLTGPVVRAVAACGQGTCVGVCGGVDRIITQQFGRCTVSAEGGTTGCTNPLPDSVGDRQTCCTCRP